MVMEKKAVEGVLEGLLVILESIEEKREKTVFKFNRIINHYEKNHFYNLKKYKEKIEHDDREVRSG